MFVDFREYLEYLDKKGLLARIKKEVDVKFEIAAGIKKISHVVENAAAGELTIPPEAREEIKRLLAEQA